MLRLNTKIQLDNGAIAEHYILAIVSVTTKKIELTLDGFINSDIADKALRKHLLKAEQRALITKFDEMMKIENPTEEEQKEINELQDKVNQLYTEIDEAAEYSELVIDCEHTSIPYSDSITEDYIFEEIVKLDKFKGAEKYIK